jgi:pyruvate-formate lyase
MISKRLKDLKQKTQGKYFHNFRKNLNMYLHSNLQSKHKTWMQQSADITVAMCHLETPIIDEDEVIVFTRTNKYAPALDTTFNNNDFFSGHKKHELGFVSNICADWEMILSRGLLFQRNLAEKNIANKNTSNTNKDFLLATIRTIDAVLELADNYRKKALEKNRHDIAILFETVPAYPPETFHQSLQMLRFLHSMIWLSGNYHVGLGRFDQYLYQYYKKDIVNGIIDNEAALELIIEFFLSLNRDSDIYPGIQQGDNGQSLMLGGVNANGILADNELTELSLIAANELKMIDPKINLRVTSKTSNKVLGLAAKLTKSGLGFPQYSNDEIVIKGLTNYGYSLEDARNYTVAACWEFIIPGLGMDLVNIGAVSFPAAVDSALRKIPSNGSSSFSDILKLTEEEIIKQTTNLVSSYKSIKLPPAPWYSVLMKDCIENGTDITVESKYKNWGIHGAASSNAADALVAIKHLIFESHKLSINELQDILNSNWSSNSILRKSIIENFPKIGNNDDVVDNLLNKLFNYFAKACLLQNKYNNLGSIKIRPGSGSAMYYIWLADNSANMLEPSVGATAEGRLEGEYFSSSLAPSPGVKVKGPFSILKSFSKIDYNKIINGGPVTLELSNTVFHSDAGIEKVGDLIKFFVNTGCQQLQLNTLDVNKLKEAQKYPEKHTNLIVRVWGWSGYFCELAPEYQNQIIKRNMLNIE